MTYPFGATKADLEKAFRRPDAHVVRISAGGVSRAG